MTKVAKNDNLLDQVYKCLLCSYFTCNKRDYERHIKTKRCITRHQEEERLKKEEESKTSSLFVERVAAKDEYDDFLKKDELTPVNSVSSFPPVLRDPSKDSVEQARLRKRKTPKNNVKKTSSGDNIVIGHIELNELTTPILNTEEKIGENEDNYFYQTIYTQPLLIESYLPIVYNWLRVFGKNSIKFFKEMFYSAGNPVHEHDTL